MLRSHPEKESTKRDQAGGPIPISAGRIKFPGIVADARKLDVSREHLWQVLTGRRRSEPLLARYNALQRKKRAHSAGPKS